jgi:hypothetical protein
MISGKITMNMLGKLKIFLGVILVSVLIPFPVYALTFPVTSTSPNYQVNQVFFGAGGSDSETSPNYQSQVSIGEQGIGNYTSPSYQTFAGFNTTADPFLELNVTSYNFTFPSALSPSAASTTTSTFYVRAWQSGGYVIQSSGSPPTNGTYSMATNTIPTASTPGTEQFGINLVANTSPTTYGANPVQTQTYSYGQAACMNTGVYLNSSHACYNQANLFNYTNGDIIAWSNQSTSVTNYTVSYVFNISGNTPGGTYTFNQYMVATATY